MIWFSYNSRYLPLPLCKRDWRLGFLFIFCGSSISSLSMPVARRLLISSLSFLLYMKRPPNIYCFGQSRKNRNETTNTNLSARFSCGQDMIEFTDQTFRIVAISIPCAGTHTVSRILINGVTITIRPSISLEMISSA